MPSLSCLSALLLLPATISALNLDCEKILVDGQSFNFKALGGPKDVHWIQRASPSITNTTFTIDVCKKLKRTPDVQKGFECPTGTQVCGIERDYIPGNEPVIREVIPIAGEFTATNGRPLEPKFERLKDGASNSDSQLEGVRGILHGGMHDGSKQKAIIEFLCDPELEGTEGFTNANSLGISDANTYQRMSRREDGGSEDPEDGEGDGGEGEDGGEEPPDLDKGKALQFISYKTENKVGVLRLEWKTKYACEGVDYEEPNDSKSRGWGFFTWLLIIAFLLASAYIIFGSWLNYNRYGARGWDLIPHGDAIRDLPYTVKDWVTSLIERLRGGGGSRGGYSAV